MFSSSRDHVPLIKYKGTHAAFRKLNAIDGVNSSILKVNKVIAEITE